MYLLIILSNYTFVINVPTDIWKYYKKVGACTVFWILIKCTQIVFIF